MLNIENKEEEEKKRVWTSCCFRCDKHAVVYFTQLFIALIIILFCIFKLIYSDGCQTDQLYSSILMLIVGAFLPNPKITHSD